MISNLFIRKDVSPFIQHYISPKGGHVVIETFVDVLIEWFGVWLYTIVLSLLEVFGYLR